ncbi:MAG: dUTP diphosphatase [Mycoplasmataceae bacterium]|nr:dUTP diphosphatase [Mycoplasmataceae bacterium]
MKIDLIDILEAQKILDAEIQKKHNVNYKSEFEELKLALFVELGELANEVRCFKFWSLKQPSDRKVILEEYVDGLHFISSLSIAFNVDMDFFIPDNISILNKKSLTIVFNKLFSSMETLNDANGVKEWFKNYLILGYQLNFTFNDIHKAYFEKNQINFQRQQENY